MLTDLHGCDPEISPDTFQAIGNVLKARSGFTLDGYKDRCVKRRIHIRIRATESSSPEAYSEYLSSNSSEQDHLLRVLTIHVSHFFRNPSTFDKLSRETLPALLELRGPRLRISSIGCAGGEEPYSLALLLRERFAEGVAAGHYSITGTDVDRGTLEMAREGVYHRDRLAEVAPEQLARWFTAHGERSYRLKDEIRAMVTYQHADLNHSAVCGPCDLILCRNVLIYFEKERQSAILNAFADALGSGGILVMGKSETLFGPVRGRYQTVCPMERIYRVI
jgi:chemotaxis protein methyltransferase CheR